MPAVTTSSSPEEFPEIPRPGGLWPWLVVGLLLALWGTYLVVTPGSEPAPVPIPVGGGTPTPDTPASPTAAPPVAGGIRLRLAFVDSDTSTFAAAAQRLAQGVRDRTDGRVVIQLYSGGRFQDQRYGERELVGLVKDGKLEMAMSTTSPLTNFNPRFEVLDLPFLFQTNEQVDRVFDGPIGQNLFLGLEDHGLVGLGYLELGFRIFSSSKAMKSLADFKGKKVRVLESVTCVRMAKAFGAEAVPAPVDRIYQMSEQGFIDAADRTYPTYWDFELYRVQKYITETRHTYSTKAVVANRQAFESLTREDQAALRQVMSEVSAWQRARQREEELRVRDRCLEQGITISTLDEAQHAEFVQAVKPMYEEYRRMRDPELLRSIQEAEERGR
ncbi:MAG: TRAP transporter substrate-binding protein DctP [Candidatus Eremiobacterota bacterium]